MLLSERLAIDTCPEPNTGCWLWSGPTDTNGYGRFRLHGKSYGAHRASYELHHGPIGRSDLFVCHKCDVPGCVNPDHLFIGTQAENIADCISKGRFPKGEKQKTSKLKEADVADIRSGRLSALEFAKLYNVDPTTVRAAQVGESWAHILEGKRERSVASHAKGEGHLDAKLTEQMVRLIRASTRSSYSWAKELGMNQSVVRKAKSGKTWKHVV